MLIAIDTGGTKTLIAAFNAEGEMSEPYRFPTPREPAEYIATVRTALRARYKDEEVEAIVVAIPGTIKDGVALWCNNLHWSNFAVKQAYEEALADDFPSVPILIENDANLAGLAEARSLKQIPPCVLYVTISTGVGTGIITEGKLNRDLARSEGGRMLIEYDGMVREWESFASGQAIAKVYGKFARDITSKRTWNQIADRISRGLLAIVPVLQPDVIVVGGSIGTYFGQYAVQLKKLLNDHLPSHIPTPRLVAAKHPEQAVLYGCYYYALDTLVD